MKLTDEFQKCAGVYIIRCNVNGKFYVGESVDIRARLRRYAKEKTQLISKSIEKYEIENFDVYVEYFPNFTKLNLLDLEEQLILKFNCRVPLGYNICNRGTDYTGRKHSQEAKDKIGNTHRGKIVSKETREKMSKSLKGIKPTKENIAKRIDSLNKPILQLDIVTGDIIQEWISIKHATQALSQGKNRSGDISKAIKGKRLKSALGFKWKFKNDV